MVSRRTIKLGALCPKLSKQLAGLKVPKDRLRILDKHAHALTWCYVHSLITDAEHGRAGKRLIANVNAEVRKAANAGTQRPGTPDGPLATETRKPGSLK